MTGLNKGLALAQYWTKRTPAECTNTAGYQIAVAAKNGMPFVTVPTIDAELSVVTTPVIGKRGKPLKNKKRFSTAAQAGEASMAVLIVQARANPNSRYNLLTNQRYLLGQSPFRGVSREAGRAAMALAVHKMIARRHTSGSFLKAGWLPAINLLKPLSVVKYSPSTGSSTERNYYGGDLGDAMPANRGSTTATTIIENNIGMEGKNAASFDRALQLYGLPALQSAVDREGVRAVNYFLKKSSDAELVKPFNDACK